jgi:hypothetical protein
MYFRRVQWVSPNWAAASLMLIVSGWFMGSYLSCLLFAYRFFTIYRVLYYIREYGCCYWSIDMDLFTIGQMTDIVGMDSDKVKNWMAGKPFTFKPSAISASGKGSRNIYNLQDLHLLAVANEFSKAGFAGKAIGRLLDAIRPKLGRLGHDAVLSVWRAKPGGPFHIGVGRARPEGVTLWHVFEVGTLLRAIDERVERMER